MVISKQRETHFKHNLRQISVALVIVIAGGNNSISVTPWLRPA